MPSTILTPCIILTPFLWQKVGQYYYSSFKDKEAEIQRSKVSSPKSHNLFMREIIVEFRSPH